MTTDYSRENGLNVNASPWMGPSAVNLTAVLTSTPPPPTRPPPTATPQPPLYTAQVVEPMPSAQDTRPVCKFFLAGGCSRGTQCSYAHELPRDSTLTNNADGTTNVTGIVFNMNAKNTINAMNRQVSTDNFANAAGQQGLGGQGAPQDADPTGVAGPGGYYDAAYGQYGHLGWDGAEVYGAQEMYHVGYHDYYPDPHMYQPPPPHQHTPPPQGNPYVYAQQPTGPANVVYAGTPAYVFTQAQPPVATAPMGGPSQNAAYWDPTFQQGPPVAIAHESSPVGRHVFQQEMMAPMVQAPSPASLAVHPGGPSPTQGVPPNSLGGMPTPIANQHMGHPHAMVGGQNPNGTSPVTMMGGGNPSNGMVSISQLSGGSHHQQHQQQQQGMVRSNLAAPPQPAPTFAAAVAPTRSVLLPPTPLWPDRTSSHPAVAAQVDAILPDIVGSAGNKTPGTPLQPLGGRSSSQQGTPTTPNHQQQNGTNNNQPAVRLHGSDIVNSLQKLMSDKSPPKPVGLEPDSRDLMLPVAPQPTAAPSPPTVASVVGSGISRGHGPPNTVVANPNNSNSNLGGRPSTGGTSASGQQQQSSANPVGQGRGRGYGGHAYHGTK